MKTLIALVIIVAALAAAAWVYRDAPVLAPFLGTQTGGAGKQQLVGKATFTCDDGKTVTADFFEGPAPVSQPGEPPQPNGSVALTLGDGRQMTLPQTISGSGVRYANAGESVVFWNEGNTAFMQEGSTTTYSGCITASDMAGQESWSIFASSSMGVSFKYPQGYTLAPQQYTELGPGKTIFGVKAVIPPGEATGTNLADDSYLSVEEISTSTPQISGGWCTPTLFLGLGPKDSLQQVSDNGTNYLTASSTGAGAGNRYEEWVWTLPGTDPCVAVRYFIHYSVIENYPPGKVEAFNEQQLLSEFDGIRRSLVIGQ